MILHSVEFINPEVRERAVMSSGSEGQAAPSQSSDAPRSGKPVEDTTVLPSSKCALQKKRLHAISKANVTPVTDMELLRNKAMKDVTLQSSLGKHMKNSVPLKNSAPSRFSNAYRSGRKRMKLILGDPTVKPPSKCALQEMLLHAIFNAKVTPVTNMKLLRNEAMKNVALQSSFRKHMKNSVQERLRQDLRYSAELYHNAEKYFN
ncbi:large proline-rich protein BAG6 [Trichonephila clavipes]|nr:large proline-rich protein BAG6 [Trichonephila clavipes]